MKTKICSACKQEKHISEFFKNGTTPNGTLKHKPRCKPCDIVHKNNQMVEIFKSLVDLRCSVCGYDKCTAAIEFHHLDPAEKDFGIRDRQLRNKEKLRKEISKCAILCANCHKEHHAGVIQVGDEHRVVLK